MKVTKGDSRLGDNVSLLDVYLEDIIVQVKVDLIK
jgi:hypothetical protein